MHSKSITIITGAYNSGKTTRALAMLKEGGYVQGDLCGFVTLANREKTCYRLKDLITAEERVAISEQPMDGGWTFGRFSVDEDVFRWANEQVCNHLQTSRLAVFDEVGRFELQGRGFDPSLQAAVSHPTLAILLTVRSTILKEVIGRYNLGRFALTVMGERMDDDE